jgi:Icc-related predicted phosphoesterase
MNALIFSDIHGDMAALERLIAEPADIYIVAGDLTNFGRGLEVAGERMKHLGERVWVLPGNHETHDETRKFCERFGFVDFHRQVKQFGGATWAGRGYSNPTPFNTPGEYTEEEIASALAAFKGLPELNLVAHFPPHGTRLDEFRPGQHGGSTALRSWIDAAQPRYLVCGHIHECAGRGELVGATQCFNAGKSGYRMEFPEVKN